MPRTGLTFSPLEPDSDLDALLNRVPAGPGVGQFLGPEGLSLLLAQASNLRTWAKDHLGLGKPPPPGRRPKTSLRGVATSLGWMATSTPFGQRLAYERLSAPLVPLAERRDLKPPAFLHLDVTARFPRLSVRDTSRGLSGLFGPFRSARAAERARDDVNRRFALRPCDYTFEPDAALALGLGCLYAQVRSCSAPCLARVTEADYRTIAERAGSWLANAAARHDSPPSLPPVVTHVRGSLALVVSAGRREVGLYPVRDGRVLDEAAATAPPAEVLSLAERLEWPAAAAPDDWPWLAAWMASPRGRGTYVVVSDQGERETLKQSIREALPPRFARSLPDDNVGPSRGEAEA